MKKTFIIVLLLLIFVTFISSWRLHKINNKFNRYIEFNQSKKFDLNTYLETLTDVSIGTKIVSIISVSGDTLDLEHQLRPSLVYYFPENECSGCIQENVQNLISTKIDTTICNIYITSEVENAKLLNKFARGNQYHSAKFAYMKLSSKIQKHCYFVIYEDGEISNCFYPVDDFTNTSNRYLDFVLEKIKLKAKPLNTSF